MTDSPTKLRLTLCSGALAGRNFPLATGRARIGRSSECELVLARQDATVSGTHAILESEGDKWLLRDAGSSTGTFLNGRRIDAGARVEVRPGDWILFGAGGVAALVQEQRSPAPRSWLVLESELHPGDFAARVDVAEVVAVVDSDGRLRVPAPDGAKDGFRFRLDRSPVVAESLADPDGAPGRVTPRPGDLLRTSRGGAGLRVLAAQPEPGAAAMGVATMQHVIGKEIRRSAGLFRLLAVAGFVAVLAAGFFVYDHFQRQMEEERRRLQADRVRLEQELQAVKAQFSTSFAEQRKEFEEALTRQRAEMEKQMAGLKESERTQFASLLEKYRRSIFLIYVETRFSNPRFTGPVEIAGYGTGWAVSAEGLVVTNKHVVQVWKFEPSLCVLLRDYPDTQVDTTIYAWPSGERFLNDRNEPPNEYAGYNSGSRMNLVLVGTAPDTWESVTINNEGRTVQVDIHAHTDADLALLRLTGGTFTPLPVKADPTTLKELDPVMLLGFPLGGQVLDSGRSDVSASLGTVRFVSGVVAHTASAFQGNSGGPLVALDGEVVGVLTRAPLKGAGEVAESFSQAIRSDRLAEFLRTIR
ncbi:MAG: trypsin-like peptidase domain-containing protein [Planctomycetota bacterium]|nr:trypsin-like peptidase domain-containing protein [Planctomycetota bacterium]